MYFAVNPIQPGLPEHILATLAELREQHPAAPIHCYLLVDACFDQGLVGAFPWRCTIECSLYDGTRLEGLKEVAPHLLRLRDVPERRLAWLQQLVETCTGKPMLSVLFSAIPADRLREHFKPYLMTRGEDSLELVVRWADTRVLPGLIEGLTAEERRHFLSPLYVWMAVDRQGEVVQWQGDGTPKPEPAAFDCWPLDEARFGRQVGEAEADAVLSQIDETRPDLLRSRQPVENHDLVKKLLATASKKNIEGAGARKTFTTMGLVLKEGFVDHPAMQNIFSRLRAGADFNEEVRGLPSEFWEQYSQENMT